MLIHDWVRCRGLWLLEWLLRLRGVWRCNRRCCRSKVALNRPNMAYRRGAKSKVQGGFSSDDIEGMLLYQVYRSRHPFSKNKNKKSVKSHCEKCHNLTESLESLLLCLNISGTVLGTHWTLVKHVYFFSLSYVHHTKYRETSEKLKHSCSSMYSSKKFERRIKKSKTLL